MLQRRQVLMSAKLQMKKIDYDRNARLMASITLADLQAAQEEEDQNKPISNPAVEVMKRHVLAMSRRVQGSDASRLQMRSQIWSTNLQMGPPSLWLTINPSDIGDPIAQVFAGEKIDLDNFVSTLGPTKTKRQQNIASDPYAAAKFFRFIITTIHETLFRVKVSKFQVSSELGTLGRVKAYFGIVESQGRGSLHLHELLWLDNTPSPDELENLLKSDYFRDRIKAYIAANLRAYVPGLESAESVKNIPRDPEVAYSRPPNPKSATYAEDVRLLELRLARSEQVHTCRPYQCLVYDKQGVYRCKRRAPFPCSMEDSVDEQGNWKQKRSYGYVNGWVPSVLLNGRCNNDGKLLTNGRDTKNITFYVSSYAAKKQGRSYNLSSIMANTYVYHLKYPNPAYIDNIRDQQTSLLRRIVNAINLEQEISAPLVISYLMGWNDTFTTHHYTPVFWSSFTSALLQAYPSISSNKQDLSDSDVTIASNDRDPSSTGAPNDRNGVSSGSDLSGIRLADQGKSHGQDAASDNGDREPMVLLDVDSNGHLFAKSQVTDYQLRGELLADRSVFDYFTHTYELRSKQSTPDTEKIDGDHSSTSTMGRPANPRVFYLPSHPRAKSSCRVVRSDTHRHIANFVGQWFHNNSSNSSFYCASMLMLLKPWRRLDRDLKHPSESWQNALASYVEANPSIRFLLSNIQYYHNARAIQEDNVNRYARETENPEVRYDESFMDDSNLFVESSGGRETLPTSSTPRQTNHREEYFAQTAIESARLAKVFEGDPSDWSIDSDHNFSCATGDDYTRLQQWTAQLKAATQELPRSPPDPSLPNKSKSRRNPRPAVVPLMDGKAPSLSFGTPIGPEQPLNTVNVDRLNEDQRRAFDIIVWHLDQYSQGLNPPPLRMCIYGEGGTGKSVVIQSVTEAFASRGRPYLLLKASYTGIAASLIDGKTCHTIAQIAISNRDSISNDAKKKLQTMWRDARYLIIDEYSMLSSSFLATLSKNLSIATLMNGYGSHDVSFGGLNVILCGDLHQFPPVAVKKGDSLFCPIDVLSHDNDSLLGRKIYEEFTTVVILTHQERTKDPVWCSLLRRLRRGEVNHEDLCTLRSLIVNRDDSKEKIDFTSDPWMSAPLITSRHNVRKKWNSIALRKWCKLSGQQLLVCDAKNTINHEPLSDIESAALHDKLNNDKRHQRKDLPESLEFAIGMKVMVTMNIETDLDIANGARGEIVDIVLHPDEPPLSQDPVVHLTYLPLYILVKLNRTRAPRLDGLNEGVIPVQVAKQSVQIAIMTANGAVEKRRVTRKQFPITGSYAFTDYRAQGQTITHVLVDLASPPSGNFTLFNLYVALSRSTGQDNIRLLRDFQDDIFNQAHDPLLAIEDKRLEGLNRETKAWWSRIGRTVCRLPLQYT